MNLDEIKTLRLYMKSSAIKFLPKLDTIIRNKSESNNRRIEAYKTYHGIVDEPILWASDDLILQLIQDHCGEIREVPKPVATVTVATTSERSVGPKVGTTSRLVWDLADKLALELDRDPTRSEIIKACAAHGISPGTAGTQLGHWKNRGESPDTR